MSNWKSPDLSPNQIKSVITWLYFHNPNLSSSVGVRLCCDLFFLFFFLLPKKKIMVKIYKRLFFSKWTRDWIKSSLFIRTIVSTWYVNKRKERGKRSQKRVFRRESLSRENQRIREKMSFVEIRSGIENRKLETIKKEWKYTQRVREQHTNDFKKRRSIQVNRSYSSHVENFGKWDCKNRNCLLDKGNLCQFFLMLKVDDSFPLEKFRKFDTVLLTISHRF